tara:strand:- start:334 stop:618 length:285 start_codon:yes stop_codon:yes gene_type:complete
MTESITNDFPQYHAIAIDSTHFFYLCPHDKKVCPSLVHFHGSCGDTTTNRVENRGSHCKGEESGVDIHITPGTLRKTLAIRGNSLTFKKYKNKK